MRILVIEDEPKVGRALREGLQAEDYDVTLAPTGEEGFFLASSQSFDLIVLDILLPGRDGLEVLGALRRQGVERPVLLLTAKDAIEDRVAGLDAGADDYLVKPFAFAELSARIRALLRSGKPEAAAPLRIDTLEVDPVSREMLARDVWKETSRATPIDNVIDVHVARLRRKIDDQFSRKLVHTVRGVGVAIREED